MKKSKKNKYGIKFPQCDTYCNERQVFPAMRKLVEKHGLTIRAASQELERLSRGEITEDRARQVYRTRVDTGGSSDPPESSDINKLQTNSSTKTEETCELEDFSSNQIPAGSEVPAAADPAVDGYQFPAGALEANPADKQNGQNEKIETPAAAASGKKSASKPVFNATNDNIEWAKWTWNPVTGCRHGCPYCYAEDIANRFYDQGFEPTFYSYRLAAPQNTVIPANRQNESGIKNVFVCSMADLFGDWVPLEWIKPVFEAIAAAPQWNFILLTKNPRRYLELVDTIGIPKNTWIGATADVQERADIATIVFQELTAIGVANFKFLSCEPLKGPIELRDNPAIDWLIIGAQSRTRKSPEFQPEWKWVSRLLWHAENKGIEVYWKPNLTVRPKNYPK